MVLVCCSNGGLFADHRSESAVGAELPQGQQVLMLKNLAIFN